ncbi:MAG: hypothetical protein AB9842_11395 [Bacteroidales bacterium]
MILLLVFASLSCSSQKRLARKAILGFQAPSVMVMYPEFIFKRNNNTAEIRGYNEMTENERDSALYYNSKVIQYIRDSIFLSVYIPNLKNELEEYGFKVFTESQLDTFLTLKEPAYVFSLAQLEVEENVEPIVEGKIYDDTLEYYKNFNLKIVRLNSWFELSRLNAEELKPNVLFSSFYVKDLLNGHFWRHPLILDVKYKYMLNEVRLEDVFGLAAFAGKKNASYLFDYLFNLYYKGLNVNNQQDKRYWHYNKLRHELKDAGENRFTLIEPETAP